MNGDKYELFIERVGRDEYKMDREESEVLLAEFRAVVKDRIQELNNAQDRLAARRKELRTESLRVRVEMKEQFKRDLLEALDLTDHPKAEEMFNLAWDQHKSEGLGQVAWFCRKLAKLVIA